MYIRFHYGSKISSTENEVLVCIFDTKNVMKISVMETQKNYHVRVVIMHDFSIKN